MNILQPTVAVFDLIAFVLSVKSLTLCWSILKWITF